jgi:hypothetical protein
MMERIREDGRRELLIDGEPYEVPHDHEIAQNAVFPAAFRQAYFVAPKYMSVSRSDMLLADAKVLVAAARDLAVIQSKLGVVEGVGAPLGQVIGNLRDGALKMTSPEAIAEIEHQLDRMQECHIKPSVGPEYEDDC